MSIQAHFETILATYLETRASTPFESSNEQWGGWQQLASEFRNSPSVRDRETLRVDWSVGRGNWSKVPWLAFLDRRETTTTQEGVYCVYLFRQDMTGVYLTFNQGVTRLKKQHGTKEARRILEDRAADLRRLAPHLSSKGFVLDDEIDLRVSGGLGADYEHSTAAYKLYEKGSVPADAELLADLETVLEPYDAYLRSERPFPEPSQPAIEIPTPPEPSEAATGGDRMSHLLAYIKARGFVFEPWQVAQYVTAIRTKPFAILAGVSGTGKSKLPALVAEGTGCESRLIPVRPDWTDSSDVLGYVDLQGDFRAGAVLETLHQAGDEDDRFWVCIVDEMNLARVEQYFAEILSRIEDRRPADGGGFRSGPLLTQALREEDAEWTEVVIPQNLALVGTVNMDETTHGFSRKVLDRAFTIELSDVRLAEWRNQSGESELPQSSTWPIADWQPRAIQLSGLKDLTDSESDRVVEVIQVLEEANRYLRQAQLQVGYRTRDEVALFVLHANAISDAFVTASDEPVDPLDLALHMKILPRIVGGSGAVRSALMQLLGWAHSGQSLRSESEAHALIEQWEETGRVGDVPGARFPRTAARLNLMWERLQSEGYTSFWL